MTQYSTLSVKLLILQLYKLKLGKNGSNDEANFPHKFLLTNTQVSGRRKAFANGSSANIKLLKAHISYMIQFEGSFLT